MDQNAKDQQDLNKGLLSAIRLTNQRIDSLSRTVEIQMDILRLLAGGESGSANEIDKDRLRESLAAAAAEIDELKRMHDLEPDAADPDEGQASGRGRAVSISGEGRVATTQGSNT